MSVLAFPGINWRDIPALARDFAKDVEQGEYGEVTRVALVMETDHGVHTITWGENAPPLLWLGLFQAAGMMAFADATEE